MIKNSLAKYKETPEQRKLRVVETGNRFRPQTVVDKKKKEAKNRCRNKQT